MKIALLQEVCKNRMIGRRDMVMVYGGGCGLYAPAPGKERKGKERKRKEN